MTTIEVRRGTADEWNAANPILAAGEPGLETDTRRFKVGDGRTVWTELPGFLREGGLDGAYVGYADAPSGGNDAAMIQAKLDAAEAAGGGVVRLKPGIYLASGLSIASGVTLCGEGQGTIVKAPNGANADIITTKGFAALTGANKWLVSDGVVTGFAIRDLWVDGNKANNTDGRGIAIYGKRFVVDNVLVRNTAGDGFYSETGAGGGQSGPADMPECSITRVWVYQTGGVGFRYRGPHDGYVDQVYVSQSTGDCVRFEGAATYLGAADIGFMHAYASQAGRGVLASAQIHASHIISESNYGKGIEFAAGSGGSRAVQLALYKNFMQYRAKAPFAPQPSPHLHITRDASDLLVGIARIEADYGGTGILIEGPSAKIQQAHVIGYNSNGMGVAIDASSFTGSLEIRGFTGAGGIGLKDGLTTGRAYCQYDAQIFDCATCLTFGYQGIKNHRRYLLMANPGQVAYDDSAFTGANNILQISSSGSGTGLIDRFEVGADLYRGGTKVLGTRDTGWTAGSGSPLKGAFAADTASATEAAQRILAIEQALRAHGLIN